MAQTTPLEALEIEKLRLECDKLRAETAQASLAWWKRAGYIGGMAPIVLALVGFLSAWITGFFDTERGLLRAEIEGLERRRDDLAAANETFQHRIDVAYLRLKLGSSNVTFALEHMQAVPLTEADRAVLETLAAELPHDKSAAVQQALDYHWNAELIVGITADDAQALDAIIQAIDASPWAVELKPQYDGFLAAPDGRIYDIDADRYFPSRDDYQAYQDAQIGG